MRLLLSARNDVLALACENDDLWRLDGLLNRVRILRGDMAHISEHQADLVAWKPDACIHLAWFLEPGRYLNAVENIDSLSSSLTLMRLMQEAGCRQIIAAGTCAEYDLKAESILDENSPVSPDTLYAASKLSLGLVGQQLAQQMGMKFAWARIFFPYGPYEDVRRLVAAAINSLLRGEPFPASEGAQVRDYVHIEDVASAFVSLLNEGGDGVYNVSSGTPVTVRELLQTIGAVAGGLDLIRFGELPYREWEPMHICGANRRLQEIGWRPRYDLRSGLEMTFQWWRNQPGFSVTGNDSAL